MSETSTSFKAIDPATGESLAGDFLNATYPDVEAAVAAALAAHQSYKQVSAAAKAVFLRNIAEEIEWIKDDLVIRAAAESGLPVGRLQGEVGRTTGQLRMFASQAEEGSWVHAIIDRAQPDRQPLPRSDIRRMLVPVGPVVVFGASNFPLAFSVAGGDTASALAAGCPVIVKAHPAHPGTSALVGQAIGRAVKRTGLHEGVFSILFDSGYQIGAALVAHPAIKAVTFTGSFKGGMALVQIAQQRKEPIPVFAEMGSINPVFLLPAALESRAVKMADMYAGSITLGAGQFCTNPGLLLAIQSPALDVFVKQLKTAIAEVLSATMLTPGICANFNTRSDEALVEKGVLLLGSSVKLRPDVSNQALARVAVVHALDFINNPRLREEVFGPYSLLVVADDTKQLDAVAAVLDGQLTITVMAEKTELKDHADLIRTLSDKAGRLILNGVPTGVEVCAAMQHGGPFPATNDSRFTSVGATAVLRFVRPMAWQDWDNALLPDALKDGNPLNIFRLVDNNWTKD
ncbi:aldehyde dehydrogenase (NADP(+)) [Pedobacter metabolipauper]|uniref:NADP-dependent aldehyde dehydrogenase n=1 Tax=Pedobacter metabolipauper TaxID=425513 RepID=A0A4R6SRB3_9SPHI|nr:aldehyde dehydrogenase (NADP(+)) [Pedobacter metabolipauper]TDQ06642.1 NADP-dependent aldehyde dehydrogenase [Pedobacter metabolipauper]